MSKKRKPNSRKPTNRPRTSRIGIMRELQDRDRLRDLQRRTLFELRPSEEAFTELLDLYAALAATPDLHPELANLLLDARQWIAGGVDRLTSADDPHDVEETRLVLELEFLFRDFAANPDSIDDWAQVEEWSRPAKFGFGKLRQREEARRGLDSATVVAGRDHWITHSASSHPRPVKDKIPPAHHFSFSLLSAAGDLVDHAFTTLQAAVTCVEATGVKISEDFLGLSVEACQEFSLLAHRVLSSHITPEDVAQLMQPRPKKQAPAKFWQGQGDEPASTH